MHKVGAAGDETRNRLCIELNYADHAAESNLPIPTKPIVFLKAQQRHLRPHENVEFPRKSVKADWEVELGIVIGKSAHLRPDRSVAGEQGRDHGPKQSQHVA